MSCKQGDSIREGSIDRYISLLERQDFDDVRDYELSELDAKTVYEELHSLMLSKGYTEKSELSWKHDSPIDGVLSIVIQRVGAYDYVHPDTQITRIGALIQNVLMLHYGNMRYITFLKKKIRSNLSKVSKGYLKPYYSGYYVQDIQCSCYDDFDEIQQLLNSRIEFFNKQLESCRIIKIFLNKDRDYIVKPSDCNLMIGTLNRNVFKDLVERYQEWYIKDASVVEILEQDIRASIHLMLDKREYPKDSINIKIAQKDDKWVIGAYLPVGISPYLILKTLYPKIKLNEIYHNSQFMIYDVCRILDKIKASDLISGDSRTCSCGNDLVYGLVKRGVSRVCQDCQMRLLMSNLMRK